MKQLPLDVTGAIQSALGFRNPKTEHKRTRQYFRFKVKHKLKT